MKAIVLVKFTSPETRDAYRLLKHLSSITESYRVYGRFDAVVFLQAESLEDIRRIILSEIHPIPGVVETMPCLVVEDGLPPSNGIGQPWQVQKQLAQE